MTDSDPAPPPSPPVSAAATLSPTTVSVLDFALLLLSLSSSSRSLRFSRCLCISLWNLKMGGIERITIRVVGKDSRFETGSCSVAFKPFSELSELKSRLNTDVELLRSDFKDLKITLQKQQEEVTASLKNLGLNEDAESQAISDGNNKDGEEKPKDSSQDGSEEIKPSDDATGNPPEGK
ncbi:hypothetical protein ZIOFF_046461 [Zingiber officinale]|uniref:Uncharacterized protein n=1 Tax=Zingiber officinale TaxID=94328 RepID=A0A8J5FPY1_ZINOF|nr:hypothetical protein ZIOFF_046461 [Zingiber officinale]